MRRSVSRKENIMAEFDYSIVKDPKIHEEVIRNVLGYSLEAGFTPLKLTYSPVKGTKGNIEYLLLAVKDLAEGRKSAVTEENIAEAVHVSHSELDA